MTTIVGFGVLSFASVPMIQNLGQTLAMGIAYCLLATLFVNPLFILLEEDKNAAAKKYLLDVELRGI